MKISYFLIPTLMIIAIACSKDKYQTRPQIELKSYDPDKIIPFQGQMTITFDYTDKEGDIGGGQFVYYPKRLNIIPYDPPYVDSVVTPLATDIPDKAKGQVQLNLTWLDMHKSDAENDTVQMYFVLVDRAGNRSDSVASDKFVVISHE